MRNHFLRAVAADDDPNFRNVTLLLPGNGTNGAQNNTFVDSSTNNYTVTRNGNTTQGTFTPYGPNWSNYFDGTGDFLSAPDNAAFEIGANSFTVEAWVYLTAYSTVYSSSFYAGTVFGKDSTASRGFQFNLAGTASSWTSINCLLFSSNTVFTATSAPFTFNLGTWYHLAWVRNGTTVRIYVNGVDIGGGTNAVVVQNSTPAVTVGALNYPSFEYYVPGYISNFRFVNGTALYTANFTPPTQPLTAITNTSLLTCQSNRFIDNSSNNFVITRNGDVTVYRFSPFNPTGPYESTIIGGSAYFDGNDALTITGNNINPSGVNFTLEFWLWLNATPASTTQMICEIGTGGSGDFQIYAFGTAIVAGPAAQGANQRSTTITARTWVHLVVVYDTGTMNFYVNGTRVGQAANTYASRTTMYIGARTASTQYTTGYISNFRITRAVVYTGATLTVPTAPVTAITNTQLLLNYTNSGVIDNAMLNDLETVGNAQISTAQSRFGGASLAFDGTGDWLASPDSQNYNFGGGNFTIEFWIRFNSVSGIIGVMGKRTSEVNYAPFIFEVSSSTLKLYMSTSGSTWAVNGLSTATLSTNTWYHVAATRSGNTVYLFLNGVSVGSTGTLSGAVMTNTSPLYIGASSGTPSGATPLNGYIDDLRITKGIARYTANFTPPVRPFPTR